MNAAATLVVMLSPRIVAFHPATGGQSTTSSASCAFVHPPAFDRPRARNSAVMTVIPICVQPARAMAAASTLAAYRSFLAVSIAFALLPPAEYVSPAIVPTF